MGKPNKTRAASLIKGYLPVRVKLPGPAIGSQDGNDETFFYVKEHREGKHEGSKGSSSTLFVANAPIVPGVKTKLLLKSLLGRFGDVDRVTLVTNPRKANTTPSLSWASSDLVHFFPSFQPPIHGSEKFAHAVFTTNQQMRRTLKRLTETMDAGRDKKGNLPRLELTKLELQMLKDETSRLHREEMGEEDDEVDAIEFVKNNEEVGDIMALAQRYRSSIARLDRNDLLAKCNEVMEEYEDSEEAQREAREAAANQPDEDGFVTVTSKSVGVESGKQLLEKEPGASGKRRRSQKRNRKKKESVGATELQDFYRFQRKETRKRTLQDLRLQFEEDLKKVKKMKEEQQYKPF